MNLFKTTLNVAMALVAILFISSWLNPDATNKVEAGGKGKKGKGGNIIISTGGGGGGSYSYPVPIPIPIHCNGGSHYDKGYWRRRRR